MADENDPDRPEDAPSPKPPLEGEAAASEASAGAPADEPQDEAAPRDPAGDQPHPADSVLFESEAPAEETPGPLTADGQAPGEAPEAEPAAPDLHASQPPAPDAPAPEPSAPEPFASEPLATGPAALEETKEAQLSAAEPIAPEIEPGIEPRYEPQSAGPAEPRPAPESELDEEQLPETPPAPEIASAAGAPGEASELPANYFRAAGDPDEAENEARHPSSAASRRASNRRRAISGRALNRTG